MTDWVASGCGYRRLTNATSSPTRAVTGNPEVWSRAPTRPPAMASRGSSPSVRMDPLVGFRRPSIRLIAVDFPAPFGPSRATVCPIGMSMLTPRRAIVVP
jgi:hypothetical protein